MTSQAPRDTRRILVRELREILRDRRALFVGIALPVILYPGLVLGMQEAQKKAREEIEARPFRYAVKGDPELFAGQSKELEKGTRVPARRPYRMLKRGAVQVLVDATREGKLAIYYDASDEASGAAVDKVRGAVEGLERGRRLRALSSVGLRRDPEERVEAVKRDLTEGQSGSQLPLFAPFVLIIAVMGGASMAALDAIAGERERGTIETLLVQPVARSSIALGKLGAVVAMALLSTVANLAAIGIAPRVLPRIQLAGLTPSTTALLLALSLPLAVLLGSALLAVTSYARSYREAQSYHYPLMLLAFLPAALPLMPGIRLDAVLAWLPVGNVALAISEVLRGTGSLGAHLVAFATTSLYAALGVFVAVRLLASEEILSGSRAVEEPDRRLARKALFGSLLLMLLYYYAATLLQSFSLVAGLLLSIWGLLLLPAIGFARLYRLDVAATFRLHRPHAGALLGGALFALGLAPLSLLLFRAQSFFAPPPEGFEKAFEPLLGLPIFAVVFCMAVTPGICEEVLFRGLLYGLFEKASGRARAIILSSLLFGAFHMSAYRIVPTALLGAALALFLVHTGSLWPCMVVHASFNALFSLTGDAPEAASREWWGVPAGIAFIILGWWIARPERAPAST